MWWFLVNASKFAQKLFTSLYMGLIVVRINIINEMNIPECGSGREKCKITYI